MNKDLNEIRELIKRGLSREAITMSENVVNQEDDIKTVAMALYLKGNAYMRQGDWTNAANSYLQAIAIDPNGPATEAYRSMKEILNFYDHNLYNP